MSKKSRRESRTPNLCLKSKPNVQLKKEACVLVVVLFVGILLWIPPGFSAQGAAKEGATEIQLYVSLDKLDDRIPAV